MTHSPYSCTACQNPIPFGVAYCPMCGHAQVGGTGPLWMGERRQVTVLFADIAAFTTASEKADPEDVIDMLNQVFTRLMQECDREEGYLDKTVGDQLMVLFGAPRAHEDDPLRAVRAALHMQKAMEELTPMIREKVGTACKINIGINSGPVVWGRMGPTGRATPTVIGDTVNLASRLQSGARNGQIIVSETVFHQTRRLVEYETLEPVQVKGKSGQIPIYRPISLREAKRAAKQQEEQHLHLVERDKELQSLQQNWSQALNGLMQLVVISGQAGIGKTRLLAEFVQGINAFGSVKTPLILQTRNQGTSGAGYAPLMSLLGQFFGLAPDDPDLSRRRKVEDRAQILGITSRNFIPLMGYLLGWYQQSSRLADGPNLDHLNDSATEAAIDMFFKQSHHRPTLLIIDDLQWADPGTRQWLNRLAILKQMMQFENMGYGLMVVLASRPQNQLALDSLQADSILTLHPLSEIGRREFIHLLLPGNDLPASLVEKLGRESGGNPFYLEEAARGLVQSGQLVRYHGAWQLARPIDQLNVPASVEGLVMANLDTLPAAAKTVLQYASVIGQRFNLELLSAMAPTANLDDLLIDLQQRGLIKEITALGEPDRIFTFAQVIVREVTYNSILRKTRRQLHEQIASLTEARQITQQPENVEALAYHYAAGGNQEKLMVYNWLAGQQALERFEFKEAENHLNTAWNSLRELPSPDPKILKGVAEALGDVSTFTGNYAQAAVCYQIVQSLAVAPDDQIWLHYRLGRLNFYQANPTEASQHYQQALELAQANPALQAQIDAEIRLLYDLG